MGMGEFGEFGELGGIGEEDILPEMLVVRLRVV